jgi:hypothetical protein
MAREQHFSRRKDIDRFLFKLRDMGCDIKVDGAGHIHIKTPQGVHHTCPSTPKSPEIAVRKLRTIERRVLAGSPPPTAPKSSPPSAA